LVALRVIAKEAADRKTLMMRTIKRTLLWVVATLGTAILLVISPTAWPAPFFAYSIGTGKIVVALDRPIPAVGGEWLLRDCERLLERSPLEARQYRLYVTNEDWRHRLFFLLHPDAGGFAYYDSLVGHAFLSGANFETGRHVKWSYLTTPPRTLAYFCAHELTHIVASEHVGVTGFLLVPQWVWEGFPDYVGIENRQSFGQLRDALEDRPVDSFMMQTYGAYPRYRLLVTYFIEKKGWFVEQLLDARLATDKAVEIMRADQTR
jgi:hypothetical protein